MLATPELRFRWRATHRLLLNPDSEISRESVQHYGRGQNQMSETKTIEAGVQTIDEERLESDVQYRFRYLVEFIGFGEEDIATIQASAELLAPLVPTLVDAVYAKLFSYDATKRHFLIRNSGFKGTVAEDLDSLSLEDAQVEFRKQHLARYLESLVTRDFDPKFVSYLDAVGAIHTEKAGSPSLEVPLVQMNALMGFVSDAVIATIQGLHLDSITEAKAIRAFTKLLWIQNDLIARHYQA